MSLVDRISGPIKKVVSSVEEVGGAAEKSARKITRLHNQLDRVTKPLRNTSVRLAAAGITAGLVNATRVAADFEAQMSSVAAKMGSATEEQIKQLSDLAKNLGSTTKFTATQTAAAMDFLAMAGYKTQDILAATPGVLNLAAVGNMELADAADIASNILGGMGLSVGKTGRLIDVLAKTATSGNTSVAQLGEAFKSVGPVARVAGSSIEDIGASLALLGDSGIQAEAAGTAMRNVLVRLSAPPTEAAKALDRLGVSTKDANGNMRPFQAILADMDASMKQMNLGSAEQIELQSDIFGLRALAAGQILQEASATGELAKRIATVTDSQGAGETMAATMQDNLSGAMTRFGSAFEGFQLALTSGPSSKGLQNLIDAFAGLLGWVTKFLNDYPMVGSVLTAVGAAFVAMVGAAAVIGPVLSGLATISRVFGMLGGFVRIATALQWAWNLALAANPIVLVIAAVVALAAAAFLIWKNWEPIKKFFTGIWEHVVGIAEQMREAGANLIKSLWEGIKSLASKPVEAIKGIAHKIRDHLPFSPAKEGPLRDINRIKIVETIAQTIKPGPVVKAMRAATAATMMAVASVPGGTAIGGEAGATINFVNTINLAAGTPAEVRQQIDQALARSQVEFERMFDQMMQQKQRRAY